MFALDAAVLETREELRESSRRDQLEQRRRVAASRAPRCLPRQGDRHQSLATKSLH